MPGLDSPQFQDYAFRVKKTKHGTDASVARVHPPGSAGATGMLHEERYEPLGSLSIYSDRYKNESDQGLISAGGWEHGTDEEPSGQQRWSNGNMNSDNAYVGWAAMAKVPGNTRLLQGVASLAVSEHGYMPAADANLSVDGARLARGAARKYGMKPNPRNEDMEDGFSISERDLTARREADSSWNIPPNQKHFSAAQTQAVVNDMDEQYRVRPKKTPEQTPIHPDQLNLL